MFGVMNLRPRRGRSTLRGMESREVAEDGAGVELEKMFGVMSFRPRPFDVAQDLKRGRSTCCRIESRKVVRARRARRMR